MSELIAYHLPRELVKGELVERIVIVRRDTGLGDPS